MSATKKPKKPKPRTTLKPATSLAEQLDILSGCGARGDRGYGQQVKRSLVETDHHGLCCKLVTVHNVNIFDHSAFGLRQLLGLQAQEAAFAVFWREENWHYYAELGETWHEVTFEREDDGRCIASIATLPGVMAYGGTRADALLAVKALILARAATP